MRKRLFLISILALNGLVIGCGGQPTPENTPHVTRLGPRDTPTPYPTRSVPSKGFDAGLLESEFKISYSGPHWVHLGRRDRENSIVVVGIVPSRSGSNLSQEVANHRDEFSRTAGSTYHESGSVDTKTLGRAMWSWGSHRDEDRPTEQLVLFAAHPADGCLVIARAEFPSARDPIQPHLDELVAIAEIVGPGL